ncbi:glycerate kinase type-2 family protein [Oceanicella actignis]|uniref:Hydroxypyruvate reductase n=1 Tax=Oceanicella actignis TaxID=1189325 RepID=A0A1M7SBN2_9RHOB|nr:glycerate kinase [Oceanicella actignis]SET27265.1 glycerate 2-kinase [Oceanicella actignis]SHN55814.1 hydroxypyruvate reductase [Oceanicella actignis]
MTAPFDDPRAFLAELFHAAVAAADPERALAAHLPAPPRGRAVVVGAGKGAAQMAAALERLWQGPPLEGAVVTRYGHGCATRRIEVLEAAHPAPDEAGLAASERMFALARGLGPDDLLIALICGGGSALLPAPPPGLTLEDEIAVNRALLNSGAPIGQMNALRVCMSRIKGGRLAAAAHPARVVTLAASDIPGDDPALIASGPTIPQRTGRAEALAVARRWRLDLPEAARAWLERGDCEPPQAGDPAFARDEAHVVASAGLSLEAAAALAEKRGVRAAILSDSIEGEAREAARVLGAVARECALRARPFAPPVALLSGGETSVRVRGKGRGGRNGEFALALARELDGLEGVCALAADTDGIDGAGDNAGAFCDGASWSRLAGAGADPAALLDDNDAWSAFARLDDLFVTGPTGVNVNDFRAILIAPRGR